MEEAARDLGATPRETLRYVTLPLLGPAIAAGALISFALSFDDLIITSFNAGVGCPPAAVHLLPDPVGVDAEINAISTLVVAARRFGSSS